ncbi:hypothetical protein HispidOSU_018503 [Sigmodon hispidus]
MNTFATSNHCRLKPHLCCDLKKDEWVWDPIEHPTHPCTFPRLRVRVTSAVPPSRNLQRGNPAAVGTQDQEDLVHPSAFLTAQRRKQGYISVHFLCQVCTRG